MEANFIRGLTRSRCNFVKTQRLFSRAQSTVSKVEPVTAKVEPKPQASLTWPDYLAIRHSKRKWQMVRKKKITRQGATNSIFQAAMVPSALIGLFGGAAYFGTLDADPMKPILVFTFFIIVSVCAYSLSRVWTLFSFMESARWDVSVCHLLYSVWMNIRNGFGRRWSHHWTINWNCVVATAISESPSPN